MRLTRAERPEGKRRDAVAHADAARRDLSGVSAELTVGRSTSCTGKRKGSDVRSRVTSTVSRKSSRLWPVNQGVRSLLTMTLSPCSALRGMAWHRASPRICSNSSLIPSNTSRLKSTRSILLTARTKSLMPSRRAMRACRRDWTRTPCCASTSRIATSAVEAPVAMLRVYCSWPGVSARMNLRRAVAK